MVDDSTERERARSAARAAVRAAEQIEEFIQRAQLPAGPAAMAEYAALLARDEEARAVRGEVFGAAGLRAPSIEDEGEQA